MSRFEPTRNQIEQSAFARAVWSNDAEAIARFKFMIKRIQNQRARIATRARVRSSSWPRETHTVQLDAFRTESLIAKRQTDFARSCSSFGSAIYKFSRCSDSCFWFCRSRWCTATQPRKFGARQVFTFLLSGHGLFFAFDSCCEICGVSRTITALCRHVQVCLTAIDL